MPALQDTIVIGDSFLNALIAKWQSGRKQHSRTYINAKSTNQHLQQSSFFFIILVWLDEFNEVKSIKNITKNTHVLQKFFKKNDMSGSKYTKAIA